MNPLRSMSAIAATCLLAGCAAYPAGPVRNDDLFATIQPGMTREDVLRIVGRPDQTMPFPLSRTVAWDYRAYDTWGYQVEQSVVFDADGRVVSRFARRTNDGGDHGGNR